MLGENGMVFGVVRVVDGGELGVGFKEVGLDSLPIEGLAGGEEAKVVERENREEGVLGNANAEEDIEGGVLVEIA